MVLGLTGGIASGKTTVLKVFQELGALTFNADESVRQVTRPFSLPWIHILQHFGKSAILPDLQLNRKWLRHIAFRRKKILTTLENIIHPYVTAQAIEFIIENRYAKPNKLIILDIPLLLEARLTKLVDKIVVVYAAIEHQIERLKKRDKIEPTDARRLIALQIPLDEKVKYADYIIDNTASIDQTKHYTSIVYEKTCNLRLNP